MGNLAEWVTAGIAGIGVAMTLLVAILAVWNEDIRSLIRRPEPNVRFAHLEGEWTTLNYCDGGNGEAIYFHVILENLMPSVVARLMEVVVVRCWITRSDGSVKKLPLPTPLPIQARRRNLPMDIGAVGVAYDLVVCERRYGTVNMLLAEGNPNNFHPCIRAGEQMEIEVQGRGLNDLSNRLVIRIAYDGVFPMESDGLGTHLGIQLEDFPAPSYPGIWGALSVAARKVVRM